MRYAIGGLLLAVFALSGCPSDDPVSPDGDLLVGTWGGDNVAFIVESSTTHIHIGCTNGDFPAPITIDDAGRFNVSGSYVLRAYPVQIGPPLPAQLAGVVDGRLLTFTVSVNDTVEKKLVVLGPETVTFARDPRMGPCPICDRRSMKASRRVTGLSQHSKTAVERRRNSLGTRSSSSS
jgi:hypothetical protein